MQITIHKSGTGSEKLQIDSFYNGVAYNVFLGEAGSQMLNLFFQGDDALQLRDDFDAMESSKAELMAREIWLRVIDPYL